MLFDLLRARGEWKSFGALTQRFETSFGLPAPQWLNEEEMARLPAEVRPGGPGYFELAGALDASRGMELDGVRAAARNLATVHLDVSRLAALDAEGCAAFLELLRLLPHSGNAVLLTGAEHLADLLRDATAGDPWVETYWSLLLEIYRLRGEQKDFERTALEYALATGTSPPALATGDDAGGANQPAGKARRAALPAGTGSVQSDRRHVWRRRSPAGGASGLRR